MLLTGDSWVMYDVGKAKYLGPDSRLAESLSGAIFTNTGQAALSIAERQAGVAVVRIRSIGIPAALACPGSATVH